MEDEQGRELCPPSVTPEYLSNPPDPYLCSAEMSKQYYCTVGCQEGNPEIRWGAHEVKWCAAQGNAGGCPPRGTPVKRADYKPAAWSEVREPETPCQAAWRGGERPSQPLAELSVGLLTHEPRSFKDSMATYEALGLFDVIGEFTVYINKRTEAVDAVAADFARRHKNIRVMGSVENVGILRGMNYLIGNASQPYFMFLERDFQLIEPATCVVEQLAAGLKMLKAGKAHVMRYRHQKQPGRPNWAARMFMGKEDEVFKRGQPNLFCNHHYWYKGGEKRWPDKMWICNEGAGEPTMWCSDSFYCNWTNNPQMWSVKWWMDEYVARFPNFKFNDPFHDIETYMVRARRGGAPTPPPPIPHAPPRHRTGSPTRGAAASGPSRRARASSSTSTAATSGASRAATLGVAAPLRAAYRGPRRAIFPLAGRAHK